MKRTIIGQKRPIYLLAGNALIFFGVLRFFYEDPDRIFGGMWIALGLVNILFSGYVYAHRRILFEDNSVTLYNINKVRKRHLEHSQILRTWENNTHFIIDLSDEAIEIEKEIFNKPEQVAQALSEIKK